MTIDHLDQLNYDQYKRQSTFIVYLDQMSIFFM